MVQVYLTANVSPTHEINKTVGSRSPACFFDFFFQNFLGESETERMLQGAVCTNTKIDHMDNMHTGIHIFFSFHFSISSWSIMPLFTSRRVLVRRSAYSNSSSGIPSLATSFEDPVLFVFQSGNGPSYESYEAEAPRGRRPFSVAAPAEHSASCPSEKKLLLSPWLPTQHETRFLCFLPSPLLICLLLYEFFSLHAQHFGYSDGLEIQLRVLFMPTTVCSFTMSHCSLALKT